MLTHILVSWFLSAFALWLVAQMVSGIELRGFFSAVVGSVVLTILTWILRRMVF